MRIVPGRREIKLGACPRPDDDLLSRQRQGGDGTVQNTVGEVDRLCGTAVVAYRQADGEPVGPHRRHHKHIGDGYRRNAHDFDRLPDAIQFITPADGRQDVVSDEVPRIFAGGLAAEIHRLRKSRGPVGHAHDQLVRLPGERGGSDVEGEGFVAVEIIADERAIEPDLRIVFYAAEFQFELRASHGGRQGKRGAKPRVLVLVAGKKTGHGDGLPVVAGRVAELADILKLPRAAQIQLRPRSVGPENNPNKKKQTKDQSAGITANMRPRESH